MRSTLVAAMMLIVTPAVTPAFAAPDDLVTRPLVLPAGAIDLRLTAEINVQPKLVGQPLSFAPDAWWGILPRWTLSADGALQRSLDSGRTWETIPFPNQANFRALAANGLEIWVGGTKGVLYHSEDAGQRWKLVQPAAGGQALTSDIIRVEFTDSLHGTLTTSDKQTWATEDGGQSWQKR